VFGTKQQTFFPKEADMLQLVLQAWGGLFYLLQKVFLSMAERAELQSWRNKTWRVRSWIVYLIGLAPWVVIYIQKRNWIAATLEACSAPAMVYGLVAAWFPLLLLKDEPLWLKPIPYVALAGAFWWSVADYGGITSVTQVLELGMVAGFLMGTYRLARDNASGYLWYILMCGANIPLLKINGQPWLVAQQVVSIGFIIDAYLSRRKRKLDAQGLPVDDGGTFGDSYE
jgi:hypothetical protein